MSEDGLRIVTLTPDAGQYRQAYDVISNGTLWFCHHHLFDLPRRPRFDRHWHEAWEAYRRLNAALRRRPSPAQAAQGASVLVQDYHLALCRGPAGRAAARTWPPCTSATPPSPTPTAGLPARRRPHRAAGRHGRVRGLRLPHGSLGGRLPAADYELAAAVRAGRPHLRLGPWAPTPPSWRAEAASPDVGRARRQLEALVGDRHLIVRVDRMELSKNVLRGFWAFEELLATRPEWRGRVVFLALVYPSREGMAEYLAYRSEVEHAVARINEAWGTPEWTPIVFDTDDDRHRSMAALGRYDVLLVNPVRDGLNLVAKEGPLVNTVDGVVVLSRDAGRLGGAAPGGRSPSTPTTSAAPPAPSSGPCRWTVRRARGPGGPAAGPGPGRTAADWFADQLELAAGLGAAPGAG